MTLETPGLLALLAAPLVAAGVTLLGGWLLLRLAPRLGWADAPGPAGGRKRQRTAVPPIGGVAMLLGLLAGWALFDAAGRLPEVLTPGRGLGRLIAPLLGAAATLSPIGACVAACLVGLVDDRLPGGLAPRSKLLGQGLAGAVLGAPLLVSSSVPTSAAVCVLLLLALGAIATSNLINTFDNADGAAGVLGVLGLAVASPLLAAPVAAFLPLNLIRRRAPAGTSAGGTSAGGTSAGGTSAGPRPPLAYMGDAGSHLIGMLILLTPAAWPVLLLPALDLARLSVLRVRSGYPPWVGDRRHLAHRLEQRGVSRLGVPALLALLAAPAFLGASWPAWVSLPAMAALIGASITGGLFALAVAATPDPGPGTGPDAAQPAPPGRPAADLVASE